MRKELVQLDLMPEDLRRSRMNVRCLWNLGEALAIIGWYMIAKTNCGLLQNG